MGLRDRDAPEAEISSASMADIAFLLIIFFMVTTIFSATKGLDFKLPTDDEEAPPEDEEAIFFLVQEDGSFLMDCQPATRDQIEEYIGPKLERWPEKPIIIYSRPQAPYKTMVEIYDVLRGLGKSMGLAKPPAISIPTSSDVQEYEQLFGTNPFESQC